MRVFASIIIPVYNQLDYTKGCIESLLRDDDRPPYELIVVDNGSTDDTRLFLEQKSRELDRTADNLIPIFNDTNRGVAPAWNQGLEACTARYIGILNNDILVTRGWFRSVLWAIDFHKLALASPFAATGRLDYELEARAARFTGKNLGKFWDDYDFCAFVMPRETYQKIGLFDENFKVGGFEDTDYCYRLAKAGLRYGVSGAAYIHHFGSSTLGEFKKRGDQHAAENRAYFVKKWGKDPSEGVGSVKAKLKRTWRKVKMGWGYM